MPAEDDQPKKKRGAPAGNSNALKHGFYSRSFREIEYEDLESLRLSLEDEIAAARVSARRMFELIEDVEDTREKLNAFSMFSSHLLKIGSLVRAESVLAGGSSDISQSLTTALSSVMKEKDIH